MKYLYLGAPYSHQDKAVMAERVRLVNIKAGELMRRGFVVFSPISHSVPIADTMGNHLSHGFWLKQDLPFIDWCHELWIYKLPGWTKSYGIKQEIKEARRYGKKVCFIE